MKSRFYISIFTVLLLIGFIGNTAYGSDKKGSKSAIEANVWITEDGKKHFICPVMGEQGIVDSKTSYSEIDGKRYYHCCSGCGEKFSANTEKYLKNFVVPGNVIKVDNDGKHFRCPVSGEIDIVSKKTKYSDVHGKRYYFCCSNCKSKFEKDHERYLEKMKHDSEKSVHQHHHGHKHHK